MAYEGVMVAPGGWPEADAARLFTSTGSRESIMMQGYEMAFGWGGMWFGPVIMIGALILAVLAIVWIVRLVFGGGEPTVGSREGRSPREILEERFARGEIDRDELEDRRRALHG